MKCAAVVEAGVDSTGFGSIPPALLLLGVAIVLAVLSPLAFAVFLLLKYDERPEDGGRDTD